MFNWFVAFFLIEKRCWFWFKPRQLERAVKTERKRARAKEREREKMKYIENTIIINWCIFYRYSSTKTLIQSKLSGMKDFIEHMNSTANYSFKYFSLGKRTHRHVKIKTYRKASGKSMKNLESRNANGNTVKMCYYTNGYTLDVMVFFSSSSSSLQIPALRL